ncbi:MAG: DUF86 domain-containing protein [Acidobacteria bacterium]|nr:DUF86 domain-containing protein [Acidobacteriota bacterium]
MSTQRAVQAQALDDSAAVALPVTTGVLLHEALPSFDLLERSGHLDAALAGRLKRMVGFRNIAVHAYQRLDLAIVRSIVHQRLDDLGAFVRLLIRLASETKNS